MCNRYYAPGEKEIEEFWHIGRHNPPRWWEDVLKEVFQRGHPLMRRMHKPDPKLPPDQQDKRSVIPIELGDVDQWLAGTVEEASKLLKLAPVEVFDAGP